MNYTENYQLPQWEKTDRILMEDFNSAMVQLDSAVGEKVRVVSGTYTGNGAASREIDLGGRPKVVMVGLTNAGQQNNSYAVYGGIAAETWIQTHLNYSVVELTDKGFRVFTYYVPDTSYAIATNANGLPYYYIAIM